MTEIELNSRLQLRHDSTENWDGSTLQLKAGEAAVEFTSGGKAKLKVATEDGQTFAAAPYVGGGTNVDIAYEGALSPTDIIDETWDGQIYYVVEAH